MITLHFLQYLSDNGFGILEEALFWESMPIDGIGIGILSRGGPLQRGRLASQTADLYSRGANDLVGGDNLEKIWEFLADNEFVCSLPPVPNKSLKTYTKVNIIPVSNLENLGKDETGRMIWRCSYQLNYVKE